MAKNITAKAVQRVNIMKDVVIVIRPLPQWSFQRGRIGQCSREDRWRTHQGFDESKREVDQRL